MEEKRNIQNNSINYRAVFIQIWKRRKLFYKTLPIAFVISCLYIFSIPRYYITETTLAPETEKSGNSTLGSIASTFGFDLDDMATSDAITPLLYPDLMEDNGFVTSMFSIKVVNKDNSLSTTYYDYLKKHQKSAWWDYIIGGILSIFKDNEETLNSQTFDPYRLSKKDDDIVKSISANVTLKTDKKTGVITINVKDQDPVVCKTIADSVKNRLQIFITHYRTNKARIDYEYYLKLTEEAKVAYENSCKVYGRYGDSHSDIILSSYKVKMEDLENDMQLKFTTYSTLNKQLEASKAKVQERTPAFITLKGAEVPVKPAGPKRMIFVGIMMFLTFVGTSIYIMRDIVKR